MSERRGKETEELTEGVKGVIIKVDPRNAEESLFKQMSYQVSEDTTIHEFPKEVDAIKDIPTKVSFLIHFLTKHYMGSVLGGQIISPHMGKDIYLDRSIQFAEVLVTIHNRRLSELEKKINEKKIRGEDFEYELREMLEWLELSFLTIRELLNRLLTSVHVNAPPPVRPPLVNVKLGYDMQ